MRRFPTISVFDVDAILKQIREIMDRASLAVQYVFLFTLAAGVVVLLAAVQSTRDERRYESAMLRTLGASRGTVLQGVAAEFSALGFLSGTLAACGASAVGWMLARRLFSLEFTLRPVGVGARPRVRHGARGGQRDAGDAPRGQHAARSSPCATSQRSSRRASSRALRGSASPSGIGIAAGRKRLDAHRVDARGESRGVEGHAQVVVGVLEQIVQDQRPALILLVDDDAKQH